MSLLSVQGLRVEFPTRRGVLTALDGVSFDLDRGEILGLVGESGAGKSMTGAAIMGLIEPPGHMAGGQITLEGQRIDQHPERYRGSHIGMVFQDPLTSLNPLQRIGDQLMETLKIHHGLDDATAKRRAMQALDEVGIEGKRRDHYPHEFSGGMRQRVVIALALASDPKVLVADEPTTALDVSIQAQILALLKQLCHDRGTGIVLITHDMGVIAQTTDRVAVMYLGRLVELGATDQVIHQATHPYTQGLMASTPTLAGSVDQDLFQIPGAMPRLDAVPAGCAFHPRCDRAMPQCKTHAPEFDGRRACFWSES